MLHIKSQRSSTACVRMMWEFYFFIFFKEEGEKIPLFLAAVLAAQLLKADLNILTEGRLCI